MRGLEALESVQYVTVHGTRFVLIEAQDWEALLDWLETLEDVQIAKEAFAQLQAVDGDRARAGWLKWDDLKHELE